MSKLPVPPLPAGASAWEAVVLKEFECRIGRSAAACRGIEYAGVTVDDVKQRFAEAIVQACRNWAKRHGPTKPPFEWSNKALFRARAKLWEDIRQSASRSGAFTLVTPIEPNPEYSEMKDGGIYSGLTRSGAMRASVATVQCDPIEQIEPTAVQAKTVVSHLFKSLEPELSLVDAQLFRFMMEGASPAQISERACWPEDVAVALGWPKNSASLRHRLFTLRRLALNRLKEWGIESFNDVDLFCAKEAPIDAVHAP